MNAVLEPDDPLVEYLLGRMPEQERVALEERLLSDEDLDERLLATTDDLIHAYLVDALSPEDRARFEAHFLASPDNREQVAAMRDLLAAVERVLGEGDHAAAPRPSASPRSPLWTLAAAAVVLLAAAVALVLAARRTGRPDRPFTAGPPSIASPTAATSAESPAPRAATSPLSATAESPPPRLSTPAAPVVRLAGRSGSPVRLALSPETRVVRVEVAVDADSPSFDATVVAGDGKAVWRAEGRTPPASGKPLVLEVPARVLASGEYTVRVEGEPLREGPARVLEYTLQVVRAVSASPR